MRPEDPPATMSDKSPGPCGDTPDHVASHRCPSGHRQETGTSQQGSLESPHSPGSLPLDPPAVWWPGVVHRSQIQVGLAKPTPLPWQNSLAQGATAGAYSEFPLGTEQMSESQRRVESFAAHQEDLRSVSIPNRERNKDPPLGLACLRRWIS